MSYDIKIDEYGVIRYYINEQLHREHGPAEEYPMEVKSGIKMESSIEKMVQLENLLMETKSGIKMESIIEKMDQQLNVLMDIKNGV